MEIKMPSIGKQRQNKSHITKKNEDEETKVLLAELLEISNRSASSRFQKSSRAIKKRHNNILSNCEDNNIHSSITDTSSGIGIDKKNEADEAVDKFTTNTTTKTTTRTNTRTNTTSTSSAVSFLTHHKEKVEMNQYWYSSPTIESLCKAISDILFKIEGEKVAFLSTPSLYFGFPFHLRQHCCLFDIDTMWEKDNGCHYYNYNEPENIDKSLHNKFDIVVIDPPFITRDVWELYSITTKKLLKKYSPMQQHNGIVIATTVAENKDLMYELFEAKPTVYKPNIPNLVYQYEVYTNYIDTATCTTSSSSSSSDTGSILGNKNPEIIDD